MKKKGLLSIDRISIYLVLFQYVPEIAILVSLGLVLIGCKPKLKEVLLIAVAGSLPFVLIRSLPLIPGTNVFIQLPILVALTAWICRLHFKHTALAALLGAIVIALAEKVFNFLTSTFTGISLQQAFQDLYLRLLFPLPEYIFLIALLLFFIQYHIALFDIQGLKELEQLKHYEQRE